MRVISLSHQVFTLLLLVVMILVLSGCKPDQHSGSDSKVREWQDVSESGLPRITFSASDFNQGDSVTLDAENSLSYRELHSKLKRQRVQQCLTHLHPKAGVGETKLDNQQMITAYCDYVIHLKKGRVLNVEVSNPQLSAYLVSPFFHDFENEGAVITTTDDSYTVRIKYVSIEYQAAPINYDLTVTIN